MANSAGDDEPLTLSSHALAALAEFNAERNARYEQFEQLKAQAEEDDVARRNDPLSMDAFAEDWNESQFWYSDDTARLLAKELLEGATVEMTIAVVSAPSVFIALKNLMNEAGASPEARPKLVLLEHDRRFAVFPEFVFYDFQQPLKLPGNLRGSMDRIICDPPFLSEDCQTKAALTVRWLIKAVASEEHPVASRLIVCTGERMQSLVLKLYRFCELRTTSFEPVHARGLSNEFLCYANFNSPSWSWRDALSSQ